MTAISEKMLVIEYNHRKSPINSYDLLNKRTFNFGSFRCLFVYVSVPLFGVSPLESLHMMLTAKARLGSAS